MFLSVLSDTPTNFPVMVQEIEAEYKKRISDFKAEIESSSNEKIVEAKKQAEDLIKRAKEESLIEIENARKSLDSELYLRIANISIDDVNIKKKSNRTR